MFLIYRNGGEYKGYITQDCVWKFPYTVSFSTAVIVFGRMIWNYDAKTATFRNTVLNEIVVCLAEQKDFSTYIIIFLHIALKIDMEDFN